MLTRMTGAIGRRNIAAQTPGTKHLNIVCPGKHPCTLKPRLTEESRCLDTLMSGASSLVGLCPLKVGASQRLNFPFFVVILAAALA